VIPTLATQVKSRILLEAVVRIVVRFAREFRIARSVNAYINTRLNGRNSRWLPNTASKSKMATIVYDGWSKLEPYSTRFWAHASGRILIRQIDEYIQLMEVLIRKTPALDDKEVVWTSNLGSRRNEKRP
jgi:hypothetical protein